MSGTPGLERWLVVQFMVSTGVPLVAQLGLVAVAAVWVRPAFARGWLWLLCARSFGLLEAVLRRFVMVVGIPMWAGRAGAATDIVVADAASTVVQAVLHLGWWALLFGGLVTMCREREGGDRLPRAPSP